MDAKLINPDDWYKFGEGGIGESFYHKTDETLILKLNLETWSVERTIKEYEQSRKVLELGVKSPEVYDFVTDGKRYGYTARRVVGKKSYSRIVADDPSLLEEYARKFARSSKELHSMKCDTATFDSPLPVMKQMIENCTALPEKAKSVIWEYWKEYDREAQTCLHGDLHMGNMIEAAGESYWIDLGAFAYGDPYLDLANMYLLGYLLPAQVAPLLFHMPLKTFRRFYVVFLDEYFDGKVDEKVWTRIKHAALVRASLVVAAKPESAALLVPAIMGQKLKFAIISFLARFAKAKM